MDHGCMFPAPLGATSPKGRIVVPYPMPYNDNRGLFLCFQQLTKHRCKQEVALYRFPRFLANASSKEAVSRIVRFA